MNHELDKPLVTIVCLCLNHEPYVKACLESVSSQTYDNLEIIVVDDGSTDNSRAIIKEWERNTSRKTRVIFNESNLGICKSLNLALEMVRGPYYTSFATDDIMLPPCIEAKVNAISLLDESYALVYSDVEETNMDGTTLHPSYLTHRGWDAHHPPQGEGLFKVLIRKNFIPAMSLLLRVDALKAVGGYDETLIQEDVDTWFRLSMKYKFGFSPGTYIKYRRHQGSMTATKTAALQASHLKMYSKYIGMISKEEELILRNKIFNAAANAYFYGWDSKQIIQGLSNWINYRKETKFIWLKWYISAGLPRKQVWRFFKVQKEN